MTENTPSADLAAAEWAVRLHERALTQEEQIGLDRWLAADTRHRGALLRARAVWTDLDRLAALTGSSRDSLPDEPQAVAASQQVSPQHFGHRRRVLVAGMAALFLGTGTWWTVRRDKTYRSKLGEIQRVTLSDGSHMVLNTDTEATVRFDQALREIELASGEGLFQVAKDRARPFIVRAGSLSVRAVGTIFSVRSVGQRVDVTVTEGVVELIDGADFGGQVIRRLAANEHATVMETREVQVQSIAHDEAERRLAWRDGLVEFAGERLIDAVEEINRHNHRHIVVDDPALASRPVVGLFRANDPDGFAATVATALGAQRVEADNAIHLRLASSP
jgi:transmembrane sensor